MSDAIAFQALGLAKQALVAIPPIPNLITFSPTGGMASNANFEAAMNAFMASARQDVWLPEDFTYTGQWSYQMTDGMVKRVYAPRSFVFKQTDPTVATGNTIHVYTEPMWIENVTSETIVPNDDLNDMGSDTPSTNDSLAIVIANARTVAQRAQFKLISDDIMSNAKQGTNKVRLGEFMMAAHASSGTTVTMTAPIKEWQDTYTTNVRLCAMPRAIFQLFGGTLDHDSSIDTTTGSGIGQTPNIRMTGISDAKWIGGHVTSSMSQCIQMEGCWGYEVAQLTADYAINAPFYQHYGYGVDDVACEAGKIHTCDFRWVRHGFTTNGRQLATNRTDNSVWCYGRTREFVAGMGCTAGYGSNAGGDTHAECDGVLISGMAVGYTHDGASSAGGSFQLRGTNVLLLGSRGIGAYGGLIVRTQKNGRVVGCSSFGARSGAAFVMGPDTDVTTTNAESSIISCEGTVTTDIPLVTCSANTACTGTFRSQGNALKIFSLAALAHTSGIYKITTTGVDLTIDGDVIDLTGMAAGSTLTCIFKVIDGSTIRGKCTVLLNDNVTITELIGSNAATTTAICDLDVTVINLTGTKGIANANASAPMSLKNANTAVTPRCSAARIKGSITTTSSATSFDSKRRVYGATTTTGNVAAGVTLRLQDLGDENSTIRIQPTTELSGSTNGLTLTAADLKDGQRVTFENNSGSPVQFKSGLNYSLHANAAVTIMGTGSSLVVVAEQVRAGVVMGPKTASFTTADRDNRAVWGLNATTGTPVVTFHATAPIGVKIRFIVNSGTSVAHTTTPAAGGSIIGLSTFTTTTGDTFTAECIGNATGSAATWLIKAGWW